MWILLVPLSILIYFWVGQTRLGYFAAWILSGVLDASLSLGVFFLLSNSTALTPEALVVGAIGFSMAFAGPVAFWLYRRWKARRNDRLM
jgi:hypothetical protein